MKKLKIILLIYIFSFLISCEYDIYKGLYLENWETNLFGRGTFFKTYIKNEPEFFDSLPSELVCPPGFEKFIKLKFKWAIFEMEIIDYLVSKNELEYMKEMDGFFKYSTNVFPLKKYKKVVFPYYYKSIKNRILYYYQNKTLIYIRKGQVIKLPDTDSSYTFVTFTHEILKEDLRYSRQLFKYPYPKE